MAGESGKRRVHQHLNRRHHRTPDVLVLGGGPAGLAAAIAAAQRGFRVQVAEPCPGAIDKGCGEGLLPPATEALARLGIGTDQLEKAGFPLTGIRFFSGQRSAAASFPAGRTAFGVRRTTLHALLMARAELLGVERVELSAKLLSAGTGNNDRRATVLLGSQVCAPRWTLAADGAGSAARQAAQLDGGRLVSRRFALRQHFRLTDPAQTPAGVEVHWAAGAQAYITPVARGEIGIAVLSGRPLREMAAALAAFPALAPLLRGAGVSSQPRGAVSVHRSLRAVQTGSVALIGDASGGVDAITGDGLALAFQQALAVGAALEAGDLGLYQRAHERLQRPAQAMSRVLLTMGANAVVTQAAVRALGRVPWLFGALLDLHTRVPDLAKLAPGSAWWPESTGSLPTEYFHATK